MRTADVEYHLLARLRPRHRWWRMLLTGLLGVAIYLGVLGGILVVLAAISLAEPQVGTWMEETLAATSYFDLDRPWLLIALVLPLILMLPVLLLASRIVEGRGTGLLSSVAGRLRWGWLGRCTALALAVYTVQFIAAFGIEALIGRPAVVDALHPGIPLMLVLVIVLIPFQAAAEEYVFRGYLMQLIGRWLRHPAFAILLPAPLFVFAHGYDIWGGLGVGAFAVVAGWLTWRTGGLEAAIAVHIVNNVLVFGLGAFSLVDANATSSTPLDLAINVATLVVFALVVERSARSSGLARTATPPARDAVSDEALSLREPLTPQAEWTRRPEPPARP